MIWIWFKANTHQHKNYFTIPIEKKLKVNLIAYLGFLIPDGVQPESALGVIQQTEVFIGLRNRDHIFNKRENTISQAAHNKNEE